MLNKIFNFKTLSPQFQDITKDILGIYVPINATSIAKVASAEIVRKKMKELFEKENLIVLSNNKNIEEIEKILEGKNVKFKIGKFFKEDWKEFNKKSISIYIEDISFEKIKNLAIEIVKYSNQKVMLKDTYKIFLIS